MALPPRPMGPVDAGITMEDMMPSEASVNIDVMEPEAFEGGAEVIEDGQGGAVIQSLLDSLNGEVMDEPLEHSVNLAEHLSKMTWSLGLSGRKLTLKAWINLALSTWSAHSRLQARQASLTRL